MDCRDKRRAERIDRPITRQLTYYMEEGQIFKSYDPVYDSREFSNSYFLSCVRKPDGKGKVVAGFNSNVE